MSDVIEGASIATYGDPSERARDYTFRYQLQPLGINWVGLVACCYQESPGALEVQCNREDAPTTSDEELVARAELAHRLGLRVMLHPQLIAVNGDFPIVNHGSDEDDWRHWFQSYTAFITHYARLAESVRADYFVIGNEMAGSTHRDADWRAVAAAVRQDYGGPITYAAHPWDVFSVSWWDAVDSIGLNPYFQLTGTNHPSMGQLNGAWQPIVAKLERLSAKWDRPVLITEIGYPSVDGANYWGGDHRYFSANLRFDPQEQADLHEALLTAFEGQPWWLGVFWWAWGANPADGPYSLGNPEGKPAEDVLRRHYGALPRSTPTPISELSEDPARRLIVYHDALDPTWTVSSWTTVTTDFAYREIRYRGDAAICIRIDGNVLEINPATSLDLSDYDMLEMYVKFLGGNHPVVSLAFGNWSPNYHEVSLLGLGLPESPFTTPVEDGWLRVRVPLAELFRAEAIQPGRVLNEFGIVFNEYFPIDTSAYGAVLIDEIRFVAAANSHAPEPESPVPP